MKDDEEMVNLLLDANPGKADCTCKYCVVGQLKH